MAIGRRSGVKHLVQSSIRASSLLMTPAGRHIPITVNTEDYECFARTTSYFARLKES
jgi:hypothetical protein